MPDRHQFFAAPLAPRRAVAVTMAAALLVSCSDDEPSDRNTESAVSSAPTASSSPAPSESVSSDPTPTPTQPAAAIPTEPAALAAQLDEALATLRDRKATDDQVRLAGEFQQLAVRALALGSERFRRKVFDNLGAAAESQTRSDVRAAQLLTVITQPRPKFPPWRILTPPPAPELLGYYREAQRRTGVPWNYLAAIHLVETRMGRIRGPSTAGALGPMQFLPTTWERFGAGGDINDPRDAIHAAARLLDAYGAPGDMATALWHYNPSDRYVGAITEYALTIERTPAVYRGYWHWRVLYRHVRGTYVLPDGYPKTRPVLLSCPSCP